MTQNSKHAVGPGFEKWIAAGCTIYTVDNWADGHNYGANRIGATFDPESDAPPTDEQTALCEQIVEEHNLCDDLKRILTLSTIANSDLLRQRDELASALKSLIKTGEAGLWGAWSDNTPNGQALKQACAVLSRVESEQAK